MDDIMSWDNQIAHISRKINFTLYRLRLFRPLTDLSLRKHLISSLIFPLFDYCCALLCDIKEGHCDKLQLLLNSCVRYTIGLRKFDNVTVHRKSLGWLSAKNRRLYLSATLLYNVFKHETPGYLHSFFTSRTPLSTLRNKNPSFVIPFTRNVMLDTSFHSKMFHFWNSLPPHILNCNSLNSFKLLLFNWLKQSENSTIPSKL